MFGDWAWISERSQKQADRMQNWLTKIINANAKIAIIEMGAGSAVPTVRMQSEQVARYQNASLIRINPREYDVPENQIGLSMGAKDGVNLICKYMG